MYIKWLWGCFIAVRKMQQNIFVCLFSSVSCHRFRFFASIIHIESYFIPKIDLCVIVWYFLQWMKMKWKLAQAKCDMLICPLPLPVVQGAPDVLLSRGHGGRAASSGLLQLQCDWHQLQHAQRPSIHHHHHTGYATDFVLGRLSDRYTILELQGLGLMNQLFVNIVNNTFFMFN